MWFPCIQNKNIYISVSQSGKIVLCCSEKQPNLVELIRSCIITIICHLFSAWRFIMWKSHVSWFTTHLLNNKGQRSSTGSRKGKYDFFSEFEKKREQEIQGFCRDYYLTEREKSPTFFLLGRAKKLPWIPRVFSISSACRPVMSLWNHLHQHTYIHC